MLKKSYLLAGLYGTTTLLSVIGHYVKDYVSGRFYIQQVIALIFGVILISAGYFLMEKKIEKSYIPWLVIISGIIMFLIHLEKLILSC